MNTQLCVKKQLQAMYVQNINVKQTDKETLSSAIAASI